MGSIDHEVTFCSDASGWMNEELASRPELPFSRVRIEQSTRGSRKRRDLTILDRSGSIAITGEVKLPYAPDGASPYNEPVVEDAHSKAAKVGAQYFVTWNVNRIVLWRTDDAGKPLFERHIYEAALAQVRDVEDLTNPSIRQAIRNGLLRFLDRAAQAYTGALPLDRRPLDEFFVTVLEAALERPIALTDHAIAKKYAQDARFRAKLDSWMRDTQQWAISDDVLVQQDNFERAAKFTCYVLVNKIVFYHALRKRFTGLPALRVSKKIAAVADLQSAMMTFFERAKKATRDYETVFDGDFGDTLPFVSEHAVSPWRDLLKSIDRFDFTQLNYDVIGPIFERLISPDERHRYGQHYTKPEIADLIEAFCIRTPEASVLDPACGGGTFLVRAYNRKKFLAEETGASLPHNAILAQLFGVDISAYATHLTTMNLATRDLIDEHNYPLVAQSDFFDVEADKPLFQVPMASGSRGKQFQQVVIPKVDVIVGNPPYVRQEEINKPPTAVSKGRIRLAIRSLEQIKAEATTYKKRLRALAERAAPRINLSGRSDLHVYFWPHATTLLKDGGYFGFLTSSGWLDVEYGFRLQEFLLKNFAITAIFESQVEPWFTGARVTTCAAILRRESDERKREKNLIRFVQLRSPLSTIFPSRATEEQRQHASEALRDRIERVSQNCTDPHWRVRVVRQSELYQRGVGEVVSDDDSSEANEDGAGAQRTNGLALARRSYVGSKWGLYLRAPDLFFEILDRFGTRMVPLQQLSDVRFGVKTGCDKFFFVRDTTERCLRETLDPRAFRAKYGIQKIQTDQIRIVLAGDKSLHLIEAEFLEPEVHSLMEVDRPIIDESDIARHVFLCGKRKAELKRTYAGKYIEWGEREGFHLVQTVSSRAGTRAWYDLTDCLRPQLILPKIQQYRHIVPLNPAKWPCNSSLLGITTELEPWVLAGVLNSTWVGLIKWFFGRQLGNEANLQLDVYAAKQLPIPDPRDAPKALLERIDSGMRRLAGRSIPDLDEDVGAADRAELDDAVLELLGEESSSGRQQLVDRLYDEVRSFHNSLKTKEQTAMQNRLITARRSSLSAEEIAQDIWDGVGPSLVRRFPEDFLGEDDTLDYVELQEGGCRVVDNSLLGHIGVEVAGRYVELGDERRSRFVKVAFDAGRRDRVPVPVDPSQCRRSCSDYRSYVDQVSSELAERVASKTASEKLQAKVLALLKRRVALSGSEPTSRDPLSRAVL